MISVLQEGRVPAVGASPSRICRRWLVPARGGREGSAGGTPLPGMRQRRAQEGPRRELKEAVAGLARPRNRADAAGFGPRTGRRRSSLAGSTPGGSGRDEEDDASELRLDLELDSDFELDLRDDLKLPVGLLLLLRRRRFPLTSSRTGSVQGWCGGVVEVFPAAPLVRIAPGGSVSTSSRSSSSSRLLEGEGGVRRRRRGGAEERAGGADARWLGESREGAPLPTGLGRGVREEERVREQAVEMREGARNPRNGEGRGGGWGKPHSG